MYSIFESEDEPRRSPSEPTFSILSRYPSSPRPTPSGAWRARFICCSRRFCRSLALSVADCMALMRAASSEATSKQGHERPPGAYLLDFSRNLFFCFLHKEHHRPNCKGPRPRRYCFLDLDAFVGHGCRRWLTHVAKISSVRKRSSVTDSCCVRSS